MVATRMLPPGQVVAEPAPSATVRRRLSSLAAEEVPEGPIAATASSAMAPIRAWAVREVAAAALRVAPGAKGLRGAPQAAAVVAVR